MLSTPKLDIKPTVTESIITDEPNTFHSRGYVMQKFVLLADRRSGTTLLIDCLNSLETVHCEKRAFGIDKKIENPTENKHSGMFFLYRSESFGRKLRFWVSRKALIKDFLDQEIYANGSPNDICGFRLIYDKAQQHPEILESLQKSETRVIHLIRENVFKTHISFLTAPMHKMHHPREGDAVKTVTLRLDPQTLLKELRKRNQRIEKRRKDLAGFNVLEVSYESFVKDKDAEAARIQPFLGLEKVVPFKTDLVKINPDSLSDIIENYDEIADLLSGTEFEQFLTPAKGQ
jgi:LPS sulfotransferase NodH